MSLKRGNLALWVLGSMIASGILLAIGAWMGSSFEKGKQRELDQVNPARFVRPGDVITILGGWEMSGWRKDLLGTVDDHCCVSIASPSEILLMWNDWYDNDRRMAFEKNGRLFIAWSSDWTLDTTYQRQNPDWPYGPERRLKMSDITEVLRLPGESNAKALARVKLRIP